LPSKTEVRVPINDDNISDLLDMGNWSSTKSFGMSDEADYSIISN